MPVANTPEEACIVLRKLLKPGSKVYTILRHRSASGMFRTVSCIILTKDYDKKIFPRDISGLVARAAGFKLSRRHDGIEAGGCGMDSGFHIVYELGHALWPKGTRKPHGTRNGSPDTAGGYALKHEWL